MKELEYISFLHQTCLPDVRKDATISASDIKLYLRSRYGLVINDEEATDIVRGLGGTTKLYYNQRDSVEESLDDGSVSSSGAEECDEISKITASQGRESVDQTHDEIKDYLDMVQTMSCLLVPKLAREAMALSSLQHRTDQCDEGNEDKSVESKQLDIEEQCHENELVRIPSEQESLIKRVLKIILCKLQSRAPSQLSKSSTRFLGSLSGTKVETTTFANDTSTRDFVRDLLKVFGEVNEASNDELIDEMVSCAFSSQEGSNTCFDEHTFANALTFDLSQWPVASEDNLSTPFHDVFGVEPIDVNRMINQGFGFGNSSKQSNSEANPSSEDIFNLKMKSTSPSLDYVVDSFYSFFFVIALWIFYIYSAGVYIAMVSLIAFNLIDCDQSFGCQLLNRIWSWASFGFILTLGGIIIIVPISIANDPYRVRWNWALLSGMTLVLYSILPLVLYQTEEKIPKSWTYDLAIKIYLCFGGFLVLLIIPKNVMSSFCSIDHQSNSSTIPSHKSFFFSTNLTSSAAIKRAATYRVNQITENALKLHDRESNNDDEFLQPMERFLLEIDESEKRGGLMWTWSKILSGNELVTKHGIWLQSRLAIGQVGQIIVLVLFIWFVLYQTEESAQNADVEFLVIQAQPDSLSRNLLLFYLPPGWIIRTSLNVGCIIATVVGILLIILYVPSTVNTILKLRCGSIPTLHDEHAKKYRLSADTVYHNVSNMIYGLLGAMSLFLLFFGGIIYLFLWNPTQRLMMSILVWVLGLTITMTVRTITVKICRKVQHAAFYRKRPQAANLFSLAMESWTLGIAGGALIGRLSQFLLASAFWIGRIDAKYLDDDVNLFGYRFDYVPTHYRKEILGE